MKEINTMIVTGGLGFIGTNFLDYMFAKYPKLVVWNIDKITYASNAKYMLKETIDKLGGRYKLCSCDIGSPTAAAIIDSFENIHGVPDCLVHFAAESHVDNSIKNSLPFIHSNICGTYALLEACRKYARTSFRFHHVSTDEVYGSLEWEGRFTEQTRYDPSSPYSASKASSDHLVRAWNNTYGLKTTISNCSNNYGPYQHMEKLIPKVINNVLQGIKIPVYGTGSNIRDWLYVKDHCEAIDMILHKGDPGETYNVGGNCEMANLEIVATICGIMDDMGLTSKNVHVAGDLIDYVEDRPGHDLRYAIDASKIKRELGWEPRQTFNQGLRQTVEHYTQGV